MNAQKKSKDVGCRLLPHSISKIYRCWLELGRAKLTVSVSQCQEFTVAGNSLVQLNYCNTHDKLLVREAELKLRLHLITRLNSCALVVSRAKITATLNSPEQFLLLPQYFSLLIIGYSFSYRDFPFFDKIALKSFAAELSYEGKG